MMRFNLLCANNNRRALMELLSSRGISVEDDAVVHLTERGVPLPEHGIAIVYDPTNLNGFLDFLDELNHDASSLTNSPVIVAKKGETFELLKPDEILGFVADGNYIYCLTPTGKLEVKKKLYELEKELLGKGFIRVSKSCLLNVLMVSEVSPWFGGRLLLKMKGLKEEIEVSRNYAQLFKEFIGM